MASLPDTCTGETRPKAAKLWRFSVSGRAIARGQSVNAVSGDKLDGINVTIEHWKLIADVAKSAFWPLVISWIAFYFRVEIRNLIPRFKKANLSGVGLEFSDTGQKRENLEVDKLAELGQSEASNTELVEIPGRPRTDVIASVEKSILEHLGNFDEQKKIPLLVRELAQSRLEAAFERVYSASFGTQLAGLRQLISEGGSVSVSTAQTFFDEEVKKQYPDFYENSTFDQWFKFLTGNSLVSQQGSVVQITPIGRDFLSYLNSRGIPENRPW